MAKKTVHVPDERLQKWEELAASHSAQYALIDTDGNLLGDSTYDFIGKPVNGFAIFKREGRYGFLHIDGSVAVEPIYESVGDFDNGLAAVRVDGRWGFINEHGDIAIDIQYENYVKPFFRDDLAVVVKNGKYGFIDREGHEVIAPAFENASYFEDGLACVKTDGKYGFIDKAGNMVIPPVYDGIERGLSNLWRGDFAIVKAANKKGMIDRNGNTILPCDYDNITFFQTVLLVDGDETYYDFTADSKHGIICSKGMLAEPVYDKIGKYSNGLAAVSQNGKCGYIDTEGNIALPLEYESASLFSNNLARVTKDRRSFIIDKSGQEICDKIEKLSSPDNPMDGYYAGVKGDKYGLLDDKGHFIVPCEFDSIENWGIGPLLKVCRNDRYGVYDLSGKEIVKPEYEYIDDLRVEGVPTRVALERRAKEGVMAADGSVILNPDDFSSCDVENKAAVIIAVDKAGKAGLYGYDGSCIMPCECDRIRGFSSDGTSAAKKDGKYGLLDRTGRWIIPAEYEDIENMSEGLAGAKKDGKWGFLDDKNEWVITPSYNQVYRSFNNGYAVILTEDYKYFLINKKGKELAKPAKELILSEPAEGMIRFKTGRKYGYLNTEGSIAIKPTFKEAEDFDNGCALVSVKGDKDDVWTFVTKDGKTHETFDSMVIKAGKLICVEKDGKKGLVRCDGSMAVPFILKQSASYINDISVVQLA